MDIIFFKILSPLIFINRSTFLLYHQASFFSMQKSLYFLHWILIIAISLCEKATNNEA